MVGDTIASKLVELGHEVRMGSRTADNTKAADWVRRTGPRASQGTFADAAAFGEVVFLCTKGTVTLDVARAVGPAAVAAKVVVDVSNPIEVRPGEPLSLFVCNHDSLGEQVQRALPEARVVKTLNIVNCSLMADPGRTGDRPTMVICGNDAAGKAGVTALLRDFGWSDIIDLGDIRAARGTEMLLPAWLMLAQKLGRFDFAFKVARS